MESFARRTLTRLNYTLLGLVAEGSKSALQDKGTRTQNSQTNPECYFVFPYRTCYLTIKPMALGCSPWLAAAGWMLLLCNPGRNVAHLERERNWLSLRGRGRLPELMPVCLEANGCCIKIAQTGLVPVYSELKDMIA